VLVILSPTEADVASVRTFWRRLRRLGVELDVASECHGEVQAEHGRPLHPNLLMIDAAQRDWDAVIVGDGRGALDVAEDELARQIVARAASRGKPVAALGIGRYVLDRAHVAGFSSANCDLVFRWLRDELDEAR
jgi:putative intracellular protease/amidase